MKSYYNPEYSHKYYLKNKERILVICREYRRNNPKKTRQFRIRWLKLHPTHNKDYAKKNKERISLQRKASYQLNKEKVLKRSRLWYEKVKNDPILKEKLNARKRVSYKKNPTRRRLEFRIRESRMRANGGNFSSKDWLDILEKHNYKCIYCGTKENLSIEHLIPISRGGKNEKENIAPACYTCNVKKLNFK